MRKTSGAALVAREGLPCLHNIAHNEFARSSDLVLVVPEGQKFPARAPARGDEGARIFDDSLEVHAAPVDVVGLRQAVDREDDFPRCP